MSRGREGPGSGGQWGGTFESPFPGASEEARRTWVHEPDRDIAWESMDYDARWRLTAILYPHLIGHPRSAPLGWPELEIARWWWDWWKKVS